MSRAPFVERSVPIPPAGLEGDLSIPPRATGIVVFAHGSGSSRLSPRNRLVAERLQDGEVATLLFDLLTREEEIRDSRTGELRFNIDFLARRLLEATEWLKTDHETRDLLVGYFGASTGGGAALVAAAQRPADVFAVVSRGGRPDLAGKWLSQVRTPTLLIVGGNDGPVISMNQHAFDQLNFEDKRIEIIPGAGHLFEEPGTLEQVADHAANWFRSHLRALRAEYY